MPRLFSALIPPPEVVASLRTELGRLGLGGNGRDGGDGEEVGRLREEPASRWHITLGFYGRDLTSSRTAWLRERLTGAPAPTLRLAGAGAFSDVIWVGVFGSGLAELAAAVRPDGEVRRFRAHLTIARGATVERARRFGEALAGYRGPRWQATEAVLVRSDPGESGPVYSTVERFPLGSTGS
ncbi:hypothetical protein BAY61_10415 [Prauserella marina]|uniref:RNA 2',3'-cyclic phosphodiesterase n=1 Tax=Prauserella marina TaxID=530584 RepID=A0A222VN43_9PSEU|nr:2'-5' RNA ligase family protein [Prauserella marina]ASR35338.1 hypothetical protein BAY61_10415 [Prauserella marina]PWV84872.1 2'-5' RNA ligase [Prauserella marina]SDC10841.1 2'-5' RNA ligase [Prauserella marina]